MGRFCRVSTDNCDTHQCPGRIQTSASLVEEGSSWLTASPRQSASARQNASACATARSVPPPAPSSRRPNWQSLQAITPRPRWPLPSRSAPWTVSNRRVSFTRTMLPAASLALWRSSMPSALPRHSSSNEQIALRPSRRHCPPAARIANPARLYSGGVCCVTTRFPVMQFQRQSIGIARNARSMLAMLTPPISGVARSERHKAVPYN